MIQSGERLWGGSRISRAWNLNHLWVALRAEVALGSTFLTRFGLIAFACLLQTIAFFSPGHFRPAGIGVFAALVVLATLGSIACAFLAALPVAHLLSLQARRVLAIAGLVLVLPLAVNGTYQGVVTVRAMIAHGSPYSNDGAVMDLYAAIQTLHHHNPYKKTNIVAALAQINAPSTTTTPLMDGQFRGARAYPSEAAIQQVFLNDLHYRSGKGVASPPEFESKYNYPAGSFLFILPFVWAGSHDMRWLYALAVIAMGIYLSQKSPQRLRWLIPILILANVPLMVLTAGGQPDPVYGLFLMVGYAEWRRPRLSPFAMGLAAGIKQIAWFFLPFYLLLILREYGWRESLRRGSLMAVVGLALNLPFILESPAAYVSSISGPMSDPMFPLGIGVISLFVSGVLPALPKVAFTVAEFLAWGGALGANYRFRWLTPATGSVLAAVPLFFAWRSLMNYFYLMPFIAFAIMLADERYREIAGRT